MEIGSQLDDDFINAFRRRRSGGTTVVKGTEPFCSLESELTSAGARQRRSFGDHTRRDVIYNDAQLVFDTVYLSTTNIQSRDIED